MTDTSTAAPAADAPATAATPPSLDASTLYPDQVGKTGDQAAADAKAGTVAAQGTVTSDATVTTEGTVKAEGDSFLGQKEGDKAPTTDAPPTEPATPIDYSTLKLAEGFEIAPETMKSFTEIAQEGNLAPEVAQKLLDLQTSWQKETYTASVEAIKAQDAEWAGELAKDPAFAGSNGVAAKAAIARAVEEFGSPEVYQVLDAYGLGNNPVLVRLITNLAKAVGEGRLTPSGRPVVNGGVDNQNKPLAERLYPAHYPQS